MKYLCIYMAKGRNRELVEQRDQKMFECYYYWTEVCRLRFDDTIRKLGEEEFFLNESRIMQIIRRMIQNGAKVDNKRIERRSWGRKINCVMRCFPFNLIGRGTASGKGRVYPSRRA